MKPGALTVYTHYGPSRTKNSRILIDHDVVLTTYGVLGSEFQGIEVQLLFFPWFIVTHIIVRKNMINFCYF